MRPFLLVLMMLPLSLIGRENTPTASEQSHEKQAFIVTNFDSDEEVNAYSDNGRILTDEEVPIEEEVANTTPPKLEVKIDLKQVFHGSPIIYSLLFILSMISVFLWLYTILRWRILGSYSGGLKQKIQELLTSQRWNEALIFCTSRKDLLSRMIGASLGTEKTSKEELEETMSRTVKHASQATWQRIGILNDIALIAPMLGLMGTVLGMFYAFYDINRSLDSITKLFDGLGISVATTVAGLCVALLSLLLHTFLKHRLIRRLVVIETEAHHFVTLLEKHRSSS